MAERPFRFGVNLIAPAARGEWQDKCRRAEELGFDVVLVPDHLGFAAPFPAVVSAAEATSRVRVGTFTLNAAFYRPTLLAREVAGADQLTGGRLELGIGTGYVPDEFAAAGLPWPSNGQRVTHLVETVTAVRESLADPDYQPAPVQRPVPLLIGGNGDRVLRLAAQQADIVGFTGAGPGPEPGSLRLIGPDELTGRVAHVREAAGERFADLELNVLVQTVALTAGGPNTDLLAQWLPHLPADQRHRLPTLLTGSADEIADNLRKYRETYGISYVVVLEPSMAAMGEVIARLR